MRISKIDAAEATSFNTERQLKEYGDKLPADKKAEIESALEKLKTAHKAQDIAGIDAAMAETNAIWQKASEEMYKNAGAQDRPVLRRSYTSPPMPSARSRASKPWLNLCRRLPVP